MRGQAIASSPGGTKAIPPSAIGISVRDKGATGDGVTDDTLAFNRALTEAGAHGTIVVPAGTYRIDFVVTAGNHPHIRGAGPHATVLQAFTAGGAAVTYAEDNTDGYWQFCEISDVCFAGNSGERVDTGFTFSNQYAGRVIFRNCKFIDLDVCVDKPLGNIANRFTHCIFDNANYHYQAVSTGGMHAGNDIFDGCHFGNSQKASSYIDSSLDGTGQIVYRDCIWEGNVGFIVYCKAFNNTGIGAGLVIAGGTGWQESNATGGTISVHGTTEVVGARIIYLNNVRSARIEGMSLNPNKVELAGFTHLETDHCCIGDIDSQIVQAAGTSYVCRNPVADDARVHAFTIDPMRVKRPPGNFLGHFIIPKRTHTSHKYAANVLFSFTGMYPVNTLYHVVTSTTQADGLLFDACQEVTLTAWNVYAILPPLHDLTAGKFIAWTMEAKRVSGDAPVEMRWTGVNRSVDLALTTDWRTFGGIADADANIIGTGLDVKSDVSGTTYPKVRFGACQMLQFDTRQEAIEFLESRCFAVNQADVPRTFYGTAAPTTGTWAVGDRVINIAPSVGQPKSWVCTVAGTPGTWTSEGNL